MNDIFTDVIGHPNQKKKLSVLLEKKILPPTILLAGPEGIGKWKMAVRAAMYLHCSSPNPPCLSCSDCLQVENGLHPDSVSIRPNEKGIIPIGSEGGGEPGTVRWFLEKLSMKALGGTTTALIDGIDRMRPEAQNALLKTIEEPSRGTHLLLVAGSVATVLPTILSRCFIIKFGFLRDEEVLQVLEANDAKKSELLLIAEAAGGSVANAIVLRDEGILEGIKNAMRDIKEQIDTGFSTMENISQIEKKIGAEKLFDILINIYRKNMERILIPGAEKGAEKGGIEDYFGEMLFDCMETASAVIRAIIQARLELKRNVNVINALRGLIYERTAVEQNL